MSDYEEKKAIYEEIDTLIDAEIDSTDSRFIAWKEKARLFIFQKSGSHSQAYKDFTGLRFWPIIWPRDAPHSVFVEACKDDLKSAKQILRPYFEDMK